MTRFVESLNVRVAITAALVFFVFLAVWQSIRSSNAIPTERVEKIELSHFASNPSTKFQRLGETHPEICMNLIGTTDWTRDRLFKDEMRSARAWVTTDTAHGWSSGNEASIPLRADGYPLFIPFRVDNSDLDQTVVSVLSSHRNDAGRIYHVAYQGSGEFTIQGGVDILSEKPGELVFKSRGGDRLLAISESSADDPLRDFRIVPLEDLDTYKAQPFNDRFKESLKEISVVRLMDLMFTNSNPIETWSDRTPYTYYSWNAKTNGYPPEALMSLVNHLRAVPWINMPHMADDDYVRRYAEVVYKTLDPGVPVIIEYSNEVWNDMFPQTRWTREQGCAQPLTRASDRGSTECNEYVSGIRYQVWRSLRIQEIFRDVFGDESDRVISVIGTQTDVPWRTEQALLAMLEKPLNPAKLGFDAIAIAPYFGSYIDNEQSRDEFVNSSFEQLKAFALQIMGGEMQQGIEDHRKLADRFGMDLVAYEGGQHFLSSHHYHEDEALQSKIAAFNRHAVMGELYTEYLDRWFKSGGGLFCIFSHVGEPSRWGAWGMIEHLGQTEAEYPKYRAVMEATRKYGASSRAGEQSAPRP
jgi:hypothetical protein